MRRFQQINNLTGWLIFLIALTVYTLTVEETASFWDCGEFIAVSYKLEVPHPPGAPFFLLLGRIFSFLAMGDVLKVAFWINMLSVISSAFTILFLHWSIVLLARKLVNRESDDSYSTGNTIALMGAGIVGSLAYTFSDSFWFSAVEAEVYAMSSFFTAFVFWAILKWELIEDESLANKWLILIAYMMGLSIGVHLLNLTTIPALGLVYYFKKYPAVTPKGIIAALAVSGVLIIVLMLGVIPGLPSIAGSVEIFCKNILGLPFGTGILLFCVSAVTLLVYGIRYTQQRALVMWNNLLVGLAFVLIGYSSYGIIIVRSNFNPPIDENNPEDIITFVSYLKREQYGDRPLLFGQTFDAQAIAADRESPVYRKAEDSYEIYDYKTKVTYDRNMLLPRMHSQQGEHADLYYRWAQMKPGARPTFSDNLYYLFRYQFGHMYWRYFMWNFAGRESDEKDAAWLMPWDSADDLPEELASNKARTNFYMLPFLLGMVGLLYQYFKDLKTFSVVGMLFFLTGLALVLYLNSPPVEPRERDYIYVGSFYAFAIWIGFGTLAIAQTIEKYARNITLGASVATALSLVVPTVMAKDGWKCHDRSNRFHSVDQARNTLASCAPGAILFTGGDNDTFPLWYVQEVEGFRTDVRVVVLSYFQTDWYIDQMRRKVNASEPLPIGMKQKAYLQGTNDYIRLMEETDKAVNVKAYIAKVEANDPQVMVQYQDGSSSAKLLSRKFYLDINRDSVLALGFVPKNKTGRIVNRMEFGLNGGAGAIMKSDLAILDILVNNGWKRPVYFNNTSANTTSLDLRQYLQLEGLTYRLMPVRTMPSGDVGEVNTDVMLANIRQFAFRGFDDSTTYNDEEYRKFATNTMNAYYRLAYQLYIEGRNKEARQVADTIIQAIPDRTIPYNYFMPRFVELYYQLGDKKKAEEIAEVLIRRSKQNMEYIIRYDKQDDFFEQRSMWVLNQLSNTYKRREDIASQNITRYEQALQQLVLIPKNQMDSLLAENDEIGIQAEVAVENADDRQKFERKIIAAKANQAYYAAKFEEVNKIFEDFLQRREQQRKGRAAVR